MTFETIFLSKIREYNKNGELYDHYIVLLKEKVILRITWDGAWKYSAISIDEIIEDIERE